MKQEQTLGYWFNYRTQEHEYIDAPQDFSDYIPQDLVTQGMYQCHIALGKSPADACLETLTLVCGLESASFVTPK